MTGLLVYGTLRKGASANKLLQGSRLLRSAQKVFGYKMFSFGPYPFVIEAPGSFIVADWYSIDEKKIPEIDAYEGKEYIRKWDPYQKAYIYVKYDNDPKHFPLISHGDWLKHQNVPYLR